MSIDAYKQYWYGSEPVEGVDFVALDLDDYDPTVAAKIVVETEEGVAGTTVILELDGDLVLTFGAGMDDRLPMLQRIFQKTADILAQHQATVEAECGALEDEPLLVEAELLIKPALPEREKKLTALAEEANQ